MTDARLFELALAEIQSGLASARAAGVVCGPILSLKIIRKEPK